MKDAWKGIAAIFCTIVGAVSWLYVGIYRMLKGPVRNVIAAKIAGTLTPLFLLSNFMRGFWCLTVAGFLWCLCYGLKGYILREE